VRVKVKYRKETQVSMQGAVGTKVVVLLLLASIKLVFGLAPIFIARGFQKKQKNVGMKTIIGAVLCIGGGVLLSTVFIHLLKEVRESMDRARKYGLVNMDTEYPFAELILCLGFLLIMFVEATVEKICGGHIHEHCDKETFYTDSPQNFSLKIPDVPGSHQVFHNPAFNDDSPSDVNQNKGGSANVSTKMLEANRTTYTTASNSYTMATDSLAIPKTPSKVKNKQQVRTVLSSVREVLVVLALSVHSLFEGLAVGLEETSVGVWQLFLAIAIHSIVIVFCIGTDMVVKGTKRSRIILSMVVLSLVTPIGVLAGIILTLHTRAETGGDILLMGVLQGLAAGTLVYITFFEVLSKDKLTRHGMSGFLGVLFVVSGFSFMAALNGLVGHTHSHSHTGVGHALGHTHESSQDFYNGDRQHDTLHFNVNFDELRHHRHFAENWDESIEPKHYSKQHESRNNENGHTHNAEKINNHGLEQSESLKTLIVDGTYKSHSVDQHQGNQEGYANYEHTQKKEHHGNVQCQEYQNHHHMQENVYEQEECNHLFDYSTIS